MEKQERKERNKFSHIRANKKMVSAMHRGASRFFQRNAWQDSVHNRQRFRRHRPRKAPR